MEPAGLVLGAAPLVIHLLDGCVKGLYLYIHYSKVLCSVIKSMKHTSILLLLGTCLSNVAICGLACRSSIRDC